jgi:hypothetical protein
MGKLVTFALLLTMSAATISSCTSRTTAGAGILPSTHGARQTTDTSGGMPPKP